MKKVTIIIMGFNIERSIKNHDKIFSIYSKMGCVSKIIFIWNNTNKKCPVNTQIYPKVFQINALKNSFCNRYIIPYENVVTDIVLTLDDDVIFTESTIHNMINLYVKNPNCIIGGSPRSYDIFGNYWKMALKNKNCFRLTIGQCMMFNKKYMIEFRKYPDLLDSVDNGKCSPNDDLVFQFVVLNSNKTSNILTLDNFERFKLNDAGGMCKKKNWNKNRTNTIKYLIKYFNMESQISKKLNILQLYQKLKIYQEVATLRTKEAITKI